MVQLILVNLLHPIMFNEDFQLTNYFHSPLFIIMVDGIRHINFKNQTKNNMELNSKQKVKFIKRNTINTM